MLHELKEEIGSDASIACAHSVPNKVDCSCRVSGQHILANYGNIQLLWETVVHATSDTEMKARIQGVASQIHTFKFLFGLILCVMIQLSQTLQQPMLSSVEGHEVAMLTVKTPQHLRTDDNFDLFWQKVEKMRYQFDILLNLS